MKICVCGYYGFGNFGDELFLKTLQQIFTEDTVFPFTGPASIEADAVIIGGGDLITPYHFNNHYFPEQLAGLPTWVYGVGMVDSYPESTWPAEEVEKYKERLQRTKGLYVRDLWSADIARKYGFHSMVKVVPDIVFGYKEPINPITFPGKPVVGVCCFSYAEFPFQNMAGVLTELATGGFHVVLIPVVLNPANPYADRDVCLRLQERILTAEPLAAVTVTGPTEDLNLTYNYIQCVDYLISFKLHPALVALRKGIPVLCLSKMGKVKSLLEAFHLENYMADYDTSYEAILEKVTMLLTKGMQDMAAAAPLIRAKESQGEAELQHLKLSIKSMLG
ncbi:polysaccharide pyruvyl transferase family protein [Paenibacillus gansuensis]|uniref:Polysaccharide pyruvyl transferase family protein n=1 Tax=Paenibacillus gansuensis TaxID=306542 RepID=A0ABW5PAS2_9BACL